MVVEGGDWYATDFCYWGLGWGSVLTTGSPLFTGRYCSFVDDMHPISSALYILLLLTMLIIAYMTS